MKNGGYSAFSSGPIHDLTPKETVNDMMPSSFGPPYGVPSTDESDFAKLEHKLEHKPGVTNPTGLAYKIGVSKLGKKEMARRAAEGRKG